MEDSEIFRTYIIRTLSRKVQEGDGMNDFRLGLIGFLIAFILINRGFK